ncbi:hypothetical protein [Marixanthomonas spongiae]|uniref:Uncharacterized protein n=1 Tax=Marixanthomonas spongiae TaxID=2174845 RepID=A0A2U0I421_9FLAO|nr:hypothetical protein [Marixanthomonas spongiae]PVW15857.1 hypothetical protein DDV96_06220 [Marixanthomonas spongiae]
MISFKKHIRIALGYFMLIAIMGVALRLFAVIDLPITYRYMVHTHSHIALLGWVYVGLTTILYFLYLKKSGISKKYTALFWATQITIVGMMFSFPFTGYALFSITFSTLFLIATYVFAFYFLKHTPNDLKTLQSYKLIRVAVWYMVLSSIGPWAVGGIMAILGNTSPWYHNAIYFYLHFQYNGWFLVALCGILFRIFEHYNISVPKKSFKRFYYLLNVGVLLTFFISILWMQPHGLFYALAIAGSVMQIGAFSMLFRKILWERFTLGNNLSRLTVSLLKFAGFCLAVKLTAQLMGSFPETAELISGTTDYVISYLHWVFLGLVSVALLSFLHHFKWIALPRVALAIYIAGFALTEFLIFYRGSMSAFNLPALPEISFWLSLASVLLLVAVGWLFAVQFKKHKYH